MNISRNSASARGSIARTSCKATPIDHADSPRMQSLEKGMSRICATGTLGVQNLMRFRIAFYTLLAFCYVVNSYFHGFACIFAKIIGSYAVCHRVTKSFSNNIIGQPWIQRVLMTIHNDFRAKYLKTSSVTFRPFDFFFPSTIPNRLS